MSAPKAVKIKPDERFARLLELSSSAGATEDPAMGSLVNLASALRVAGQAPGLPMPDPDFRAALRQRLVAVATVQEPDAVTHGARSPKQTVADISYRTRRRLAALAGTFAVATSVAGVGVAAAHSLPGDPFYGVKRATESVQLWVTRGDDAKGKRHLQFARQRLAEAKALPSDSSHIVSTLAAMDSQTTQGTDELIASYQSTHATAPLADLLTFSRIQAADLLQLAPTLTPAAQAAEAKSLLLVKGVVVQVRHAAPGVCVLCAPGLAPTPNGSTQSPSPSPHKSAHPSKHPSNGASAPAGSSSQPSGGASPRHSGGLPTTPPTSLLPTHQPTRLPTGNPTKLLPTQLPTKSLQSTLNHHKPTPLPILSSVLGGVGH
jgi:hypothetical protein